ncbi:C40 family peptidase [Flindersiella endophytica]
MARIFVVFALVLGIGLSTVVPAGPGGSPGPGGTTAYAAPDPDGFPSKDDVDQAKQKAATAADEAGRIEAQLAAANSELRRLDGQFEMAAEAYNQARYELQQADHAAKAAKSRAASARRAAEDKRRAVGAFAARTYQQGGEQARLSGLLSTSDPQQLIDRVAQVRHVSDAAAANLQKLQAARAVSAVLDRQAAAAREQRQAAAAAADQAKTKAEQALAEQDRAVEAVERQKEAQLARLAELRHTSVQLAKQRQAGLEELARKRAEEQRRKAAAEAARRAREAAERDRRSGSGDSGSDGSDVPARGTASEAVRYALAQVGEPYVFGAAGPGTWDCSGLTMRAWAQAGVSMPHFARGQYWQSKHIGLGDLRPGDLIFWANDPGDSNTIHHVAMYLGNGRMVHAPRPGRSVEIQSMWYMGTPTHYARP